MEGGEAVFPPGTPKILHRPVSAAELRPPWDWTGLPAPKDPFSTEKNTGSEGLKVKMERGRYLLAKKFYWYLV